MSMFFFSSRRRHTRWTGDWSSDVCSSDLIVVGTVIQVLLPMPWLRGLDGRLRVLIDWRDPAVSRVLKLMLPVTLGLGLINFNAVVDSIFASRLIDPKLAPTAIDRAFRLYM